MTDKEFWTNAYLEAYKTMLSIKGKNLFNYNEVSDEQLNLIDTNCAICADIADNALEYFKINMEAMSQTAKKEIKEKEKRKNSLR